MDEVIYNMQRQLTDCEGYSAAKGLFIKILSIVDLFEF